MINACSSGDFNPRAPYGARRRGSKSNALVLTISIHAPHTGRDLSGRNKKGSSPAFQSTRPIRGATALCYHIVEGIQDFNPRAPYGARRRAGGIQEDEMVFQSTRPIRGATSMTGALSHSILFQSTRPIRGATYERDKKINSRLFQSTRPIRGATAKMHNLCSAFLQQQTIKA